MPCSWWPNAENLKCRSGFELERHFATAQKGNKINMSLCMEWSLLRKRGFAPKDIAEPTRTACHGKKLPSSSQTTLRVEFNYDCCCLLSCENIIYVHLSCALAMLGPLRRGSDKRKKPLKSSHHFKVEKKKSNKMAFKMEEGAGQARKASASPVLVFPALSSPN